MKRIIVFITILVFNSYLFAQSNTKVALAEQYYANAEYEKAVELYEDLFQANSENKHFYSQYIECLLQLQSFDKAEKVIKRQIKRYPKDLPLRVGLGYLYASKGDKEKSLKEYQSAIDLLNTADQALVADLSDSFHKIGELDYVIKVYEKARKIFRNPFLFSNELTRIYSLKNNKQGIIDEQLGMLDSDPYLLQEVQNNLQNYLSEDSDLGLLKTNLLKRSQKDPDNLIYTQLLIWTFVQQRDFEPALTQTIALDKRLKEDGEKIIGFAQFCNSNKAYDAAIKAYDNIKLRGKENPHYTQASLGLLESKKLKITSSTYTTEDLLTLEGDYVLFLQDFGENGKTVHSMRELAELKSNYLNKAAEGAAILEKIIGQNLGNASVIGRTKLDLGDTYLIMGDIWEAALLYGQVDKAFRDEPLGQMAKFKNAKLSYYAGEFDWAKAQLDVLKASTSQLIANDALNLSLIIADNTGLDTSTHALEMYAHADLLIHQNQFEAATKVLDSINHLYTGHALADDLLWAKAQIAIKQNNYTQAVELLNDISTAYSYDIWADDALFTAAEIYAGKLGNKQKAMELYEKIIVDYPGSLFVVEARKRFRALRGDVIN